MPAYDASSRPLRTRSDREGRLPPSRANATSSVGRYAVTPVSTRPPNGQLARRENGRRLLTTSGAALGAIGVVNLIFAVDSVPAILAITSDALIVFAANAFALLGLRPLFFLVAELVERLYYLKTTLAALLVFIGAKLAAAEFVDKIEPEISLPMVTAILAAGVSASLRSSHRLAHLASSNQKT